MNADIEKMNAEIGRRVKEYRRESGIDQRQMAERIGVSYRAYQNRETGVKPFPVVELVLISRILGVSLELLITGEEPSTDLTDEEQRVLRGWRKIGDKDKRFIFGVITDALLEIAEKD